MLCLSRKRGEEIVIVVGEYKIRVTVVDIRTGGAHPVVRVGIDAPRAVPVHRKEVWDEIVKSIDAGKSSDERKDGSDGGRNQELPGETGGADSDDGMVL